jgi:hypothetical protein
LRARSRRVCRNTTTTGEDGAELDRDLEGLARRALEAEQLAEEDEVAGRGDRQEFGQALDDAHQQGGEDGAEVHHAAVRKVMPGL